MSDHQAIIEFKQLIQSEISDFFAGLGQLGEPVKPEIMQKLLLENIEQHFAEVEKKWFLFPSQDLVWMTRDEFNHYCAINKMKPVNLEFLRQFALSQLETSKFSAKVDFWNCGGNNVEFMRNDAFEWIQLARGLSREIRKLGGL